MYGKELITDNDNGYITAVNSVLEMKEKLEYLLENKKVRQEMGIKNLENQFYTIENLAKQHIKAFKNCLKRIKYLKRLVL